MMLMNIFIKPIVIFIFLSLFSSFSVAVDIPPGQAIAPPPGKSSIRFELNSVKLGEGFKSGKSLNLGSELNVNTLGVQYSRSFMIRDRLADRPTFLNALAAVSGGRLIPVPGGVLIYDKEGEAIGAVGVSGDTSDKDEYCAIAAIKAEGYQPEPGDPSATWRESNL